MRPPPVMRAREVWQEALHRTLMQVFETSVTNPSQPSPPHAGKVRATDLGSGGVCVVEWLEKNPPSPPLPLFRQGPGHRSGWGWAHGWVGAAGWCPRRGSARAPAPRRGPSWVRQGGYACRFIHQLGIHVHIVPVAATRRGRPLVLPRPRYPAPRTALNFLIKKGLVSPPSTIRVDLMYGKGPVCPPSKFRAFVLIQHDVLFEPAGQR